MKEPVVEVDEDAHGILVSYGEEIKRFESVQEAVNFAREKYIEYLGIFGTAALCVKRKFYYDDK